jgi:serine/threonine protein kinase
MEYLEGETLAQRLLKGPMPLKHGLLFGAQIADSLATAHRAGILHRDLKPGNVMLTSSGAKLMDFGLAKAVPEFGAAKAAASGQTPSTPTLSLAALSSPVKPLTQQGTIVGTFQYMAPEVLRGVEADVRSDIFSLGCVMYEMVAIATLYTEGFSDFVASAAASIASGWSEPVPGLVCLPLWTSAFSRRTVHANLERKLASGSVAGTTHDHFTVSL